MKGVTRKRLPLKYGSASNWDELIKLVKKTSVPEILDQLKGEEKEKRKWDIKEDSANFDGTSDTPLTSLEEALEFCKVDLDVWLSLIHI